MARVPAKKTAKKAVKKKPSVRTPPKRQSSALDKAIDIVKWVDTPFKLLSVIMLGVFGLTGYVVYENQAKVMDKLISHNAMPVVVSDDKIVSLSQALMRDIGAETVIVHEINLATNARVTRVVLSKEGRYASLEGSKGAFFSGNPARNHAAVSMLNGEVMCEDFEASSGVGDWVISRGVTYSCRGSIPPEAGNMVGYIAVGFKGLPRDVVAAKARINQAAKSMAH
jgi:hypothetical protein